MADPKKGTGKKPKGSGRRLYTDENPRDTVKIKFATPADARATVAKVKRINKPFARKIQILTVMEQRAKVMGKSQVASQVGLVMAMGSQCYKDKERYPEGPWCKEKDWVMFARYAGSRIKIDGGEMRLLNDDEVLATIKNPEDILHEY